MSSLTSVWFAILPGIIVYTMLDGLKESDNTALGPLTIKQQNNKFTCIASKVNLQKKLSAFYFSENS